MWEACTSDISLHLHARESWRWIGRRLRPGTRTRTRIRIRRIGSEFVRNFVPRLGVVSTTECVCQVGSGLFDSEAGVVERPWYVLSQRCRVCRSCSLSVRRGQYCWSMLESGRIPTGTSRQRHSAEWTTSWKMVSQSQPLDMPCQPPTQEHITRLSSRQIAPRLFLSYGHYPTHSPVYPPIIVSSHKPFAHLGVVVHMR
ncbi:hypothetical protein OH77DRAFT_101407 [Trametes cingulata]|nr:hypothetical protein OH77DRAFT_101407 [Trametes cingulata]